MSANTTPALGANWRFDFDYGLLVSTASEILVSLPSGALYDFNKDTGGVFRLAGEEPDHNLTYSPAPTDAYDFTTSDDTVIHFVLIAGNYRPTTIKLRSGYIRTVAYDTATGQASSVSDNLGRSFNLVWTNGQLTSITTTAGIQINYGYKYTVSTAAGPVIDTRLLASASVVSSTQTETTSYVYEDTIYPRLLSGIIDARGVRYGTYRYDDAGRIISETHPNSADNMTFAYSGISGGASTTTVTNSLGKQTVYNFQTIAGGRRSSGTTGLASPSCPTSSRTVEYDTTTGRISKTIDEEGRATTYVRDARGQPTSMTRGFGAPEAVTTGYTYHPTLHVATQTATITLPSGALLVMNANGQYTYDPHGAFASLSANQNATDQFTYTITDGQGGTSQATVTIQIQGQNDAPVASADANTTNPQTPVSAGRGPRRSCQRYRRRTRSSRGHDDNEWHHIGRSRHGYRRQRRRHVHNQRRRLLQLRPGHRLQ